MMTVLAMIGTVIRQCLYALAFFSVTAILAEWIVPGSVTPFLDPVPLVIASLLLLTIVAFSGRRTRS